MELAFKFDTYARVNTPLVEDGIITMLGYQDGIIKYYVESSKVGVSDNWWPEHKVEKPLV